MTACSQSEKHDFHRPGKIPIDPQNWYILNSVPTGIRQLFDEKLTERPDEGRGKALSTYEAWYPLGDGEQMTIDSIEMYDYEGTTQDNPMTIYAVLDNWQRVVLATFTGMRYNKWNGPYPETPDDFKLKQSVGNIRYLVISCTGILPTEIEFYGKYTPPKPTPPIIVKPTPLKNFFGINGFEWNFEDPKNSGVLNPSMINAVRNFTCFRHYLDWEKIEPAQGSYTFNPSRNGGWNYDTIYQWCKDNRMDVLVCFKNNPPWMLESYPGNLRDNENIPMFYAKDPADPASYIEQSRAAFQFVARYGHNKDIVSMADTPLVKVDATPRWQNDIVNQVREGLGLIDYIECNNETDKWWKGQKAYQTGRQYAANLSAFYDGNKNKMGAGVGVKNADPSIKVVMAGVANTSTDYLRGMIDWCKEFRGYKQDGKPDLPWDVINYHYYSCEFADKSRANAKAAGVAPELSNTQRIAKDFLWVAHKYAGDMPVWVTESGYDLNQGSPQRAIPIGNKPPNITQADWILRTSMLYARTGISKLFFYELYDDNGTEIKYGTSGLLNGDHTKRPATDYISQVNKLFGNYTYFASVSNTPVVDNYVYNNTDMFVLFVPDQVGKVIDYKLDMGKADSVIIYTPAAGKNDMDVRRQAISNGKLDIQVTETPVFVVPVSKI